MLARIVVFLGVLTAAFAFAEQPDSNQGNWEGEFTRGNMSGTPVRAEIIGQRHGYAANLYVGEFPGERVARWARGSEDRRERIVFSGRAALSAEMGGEFDVEMTLADGEITGRFRGRGAPGRFTLRRVEKKSPTLGAEPPEGALVLYDGTNLDAWQPAEQPWKILPDGALEVGKGALRTKEELGEGLYHVEFRTPYMPDKRGQSRGNSGVFIFGRYEVQVLDSFALDPADNECGGIYKLATPLVNATLPPMEWQTYDITFRAPKFDEQGQKTRNAVISVLHNGILIHDNVELKEMTGGRVSDQEATKGILFLQDHRDKVQYRNIWFKPLQAD